MSITFTALGHHGSSKVGPRIEDYICRNQDPIPSSFMTYHRVCNTTGATNKAGTAYTSVAPGFNPSAKWVRVAQSLVVCGVCWVHCLSCLL
jgi:hypothetical protein